MKLFDKLFRKTNKPSLKELTKASESGDPQAQTKLGFVFADGDGVPRDFREAYRWFRLAAEQGHAEAQFCVGVITDSGEGTTQDVSQAAYWATQRLNFDSAASTKPERVLSKIVARRQNGSAMQRSKAFGKLK